VAGFEIGDETGLQHYQGYVAFYDKIRRNQLLQLLGRPVHTEVAIGGMLSNYGYCSKGGDVRFIKGIVDRTPPQERKMNWEEMTQDF
jgi:hypothetical protein